MIAAAALFLAIGPLSLKPGIRTFPEIAALVGETPTEVKCDPAIAHRAAFVSAKAISREGLLRALDLEIVPNGKGKRLKDAAGTREREWASDFRLALGRRYERTLAAAMAAIDAPKRTVPKDDWAWPYLMVLRDPAATPKDRRKADDAFLTTLGQVLAHSAEDGASEAAMRTLAAFPSSVPPELLRDGTVVDTVPLDSLPETTLRALKAAYPALRGGAGSVAVRRRTFGGQWGPLGMHAALGIVDPGVVVPPTWGLVASSLPIGPETSIPGSFLRSKREGTFRLREYDVALAAIRAREPEGYALADRYAAELSPERVPEATSLSQVLEAWGEKGLPVIGELNPPTEGIASVFENGKLRREGDWSPESVEGVLVLRSFHRFIGAPRRYPFAALLALEATGERPSRGSMYGMAWPASEAMARYVRHAGPFDRWNFMTYRGWETEALDRGAISRRVREMVPLSTWTASEDVLRAILAKDPLLDAPDLKRKVAEHPAGVWEHRLTDLSPATRSAIADEMRADQYSGGNILAYSPAALALFLREGTISVNVRDTMRGYLRDVRVSVPELPAMPANSGGAGLSGE